MSKQDKVILLAAREVEVKAGRGDGKRPRVEMLAYAGGLLKLPDWSRPVVIDLAGLDIDGRVQFLAGHDNELNAIIGQGTARVEGGRLYAEGTLTEATEAGAKVIALARDDVELSASVGVDPRRIQTVRSGTVAVNGRSLEVPDGGFLVVREGKLREVSLLPLGADENTSVSIAARRRKMEDNDKVTDVDVIQTVRDAEAGETERVGAIRKLCNIEARADMQGRALTADRAAEIEAEAIREGWDAARTELAILREARPKTGPEITLLRSSDRAVTPDVLAGAVLMHAGRESLVETAYGAKTAQRAFDLRCNSLVDVCAAALRLDGVEAPRGTRDMVKAAFSTRSLPVALGNAAEKVLQEAYANTRATWRSFVRIRPAVNFKSHKVIRPTYGGNLEEVAGDGELKHAVLGEETGTFSIGTFGKLLTVSRQDVINDDSGVISQTAAAFGRMARRSLNDKVWEVILANAGDFFHSDNGNLLTGAGSALDGDALSSAITAMRTQRDADDNDLDISPAVLAVPPELEVTGRGLLESLEVQAAEGDPSGNALKGAASLEVESRISNTAKFANASSTLWYLFGSPADSPVVVGFLDGRQTPTVEFMGLDSTVNMLAVSWRVYFDYGATLDDPRAGVRADGA